MIGEIIFRINYLFTKRQNIYCKRFRRIHFKAVVVSECTFVVKMVEFENDKVVSAI